ncbi:hypothetical protein B7463_g7018, partial [Scytalidium lignicola]
MFPNDYIFNQLLHIAQEFHGKIIYDTFGFEADYARVFQDILEVCSTLREHLLSSAFNVQGLLHEDTSNICVLSLGGYEFIIAFYAILALGGACVPLASGVLLEETAYFMQKAKSSCMLFGVDRLPRVTQIKRYMQESANQEITFISLPNTKEHVSSKINVEIDSQIVLSPSQPALIIFTSGTTGTPKGVVLPRRRFHWKYIWGQDGNSLAYRPPHWIGGARTLLQPLLSGQRLHILPNRADPETFWKCFRENQIGCIATTPTLLRQLKDYFQQHLSQLPPQDVAEYINGVMRLKEISCSSAMIESSVWKFWRTLCKDVPVCNVYALTEAGIVTKTRPESKLKHSIGTPLPGVSIKLSEGNHGEASVLTPTIYLGDEETTEASFDNDGYFKTGDILRRVGDEYIIEGRATIDFILFYGYRIPVLELEQSLMELPYISEAFVIGAPDHEAKELPAAIVRLGVQYHSVHMSETGAPAEKQITLKRIRNDLSATLAIDKLPAILRILREGDDVPRTPSEKPIKRGLLKQFFNISDFVPLNYCEPGVEYWGNQPEQVLSQTRPWDWCGLQRDD